MIPKMIFFWSVSALLAASASGARIDRVLHDLADADAELRKMDETFKGKGGGSWGDPLLEDAAIPNKLLLRSGLLPVLPEVAVADDGEVVDGDCMTVCEDDVLDDDVCIGTPSNPIPKGDVWLYSRDIPTRFIGCCFLGLGECKECCPPTEEDRLLFEHPDDTALVKFLYDTAEGESIDNFDSTDNADDPWKSFAGVCLTLNNFTILEPGNVPLSHAMNKIVQAGVLANGNGGRTRNGFFFINDGDVYHEMSQLSFVGSGSITYRILGYDYGEGRGPDLPGTKRVVELPWQLAPHGRAIWTELEADPAEYEDGDKIVYHLVSPYIGDVLVKLECCTAEELVTYEDVAEGVLGFLTRPDPPVHYTTTAEECQLLPPAYETYGTN